MQAPTFTELRALSDQDLIRLHDDLARSTQVGLAYVLEETARRRADRQMTTVVRLTWVITVATIVNVLLFAVSLFVE